MANRIRALREAAGLSQEALAERVGTSGQQISRLENEDRRLTADWMGRIAPALGVPQAALLPEAGAGELVHDPAELLLLGTWRELSKQQRERVLSFIRFELSDAAKPNDVA